MPLEQLEILANIQQPATNCGRTDMSRMACLVMAVLAAVLAACAETRVALVNRKNREWVAWTPSGYVEAEPVATVH